MLYPNFVKYDKIIFSILKQYLAPKSVKSWVSHPSNGLVCAHKSWNKIMFPSYIHFIKM